MKGSIPAGTESGQGRRIFLGSLFHETHGFLAEIGKDALRSLPAEALLACAGDGSPLAAAIEYGRQHGWEIRPGPALRASPSGPIPHETYLRYREETVEKIAEYAESLDAIFLVLHGAMVTRECDDCEGDLLEAIRAATGQRPDLPVFGILDLHGNFTPRMARHANALYAYCRNPHTDAVETARVAARELDRFLTAAGDSPWSTRLVPTGQELPPILTGTEDDPMRSLLARAREIEDRSAFVRRINVFAGFPYQQSPHRGVSFSVITSGPVDAEIAAEIDRLPKIAASLCGGLRLPEEPLETILQREAARDDGPVILIEASDNIGGGTPGDATGLLRGILESGIEEPFLCVINDPESAGICHRHAVGDSFSLMIGGKADRHHGDPVAATVTLQNLSDGRFTLEDPNSHLASMAGVHIDMGPTATVAVGPHTVIITSVKTPPMDLGQVRSQGIDPGEFRFIGVKAAVAHRAAYDPIAKRSYHVDTPGMTHSDLGRLPQ